jgi:hypothetical protein
MKKICYIFLSAVILQALIISTAFAGTNKAIYTIGSKSYSVNGSEFEMDVAPYVKNGRTFLPIRYIAYGLGMKDSGISFTHDTVTLAGNKEIKVGIGIPVIYVDGSIKKIDAAPEMRYDRVFLPVRHIVEAFGGKIQWIPESQKVEIVTESKNGTVTSGSGIKVGNKVIKYSELKTIIKNLADKYDITLSDSAINEIINNVSNKIDGNENFNTIINYISEELLNNGATKEDIRLMIDDLSEEVKKYIDDSFLNNETDVMVTGRDMHFNELQNNSLSKVMSGLGLGGDDVNIIDSKTIEVRDCLNGEKIILKEGNAFIIVNNNNAVQQIGLRKEISVIDGNAIVDNSDAFALYSVIKILKGGMF